jgi:hypothetical protein
MTVMRRARWWWRAVGRNTEGETRQEREGPRRKRRRRMKCLEREHEPRRWSGGSD